MKDSIFLDKFFRAAFAASLISHTFLFVKGPNLSFSQNDKPIEITYMEPELPARDSTVVKKDVILNKPPLAEKSVKIKAAKKCFEEEKIFEEKQKAENKGQEILVKETKKDVSCEEKSAQEMPEFSDYYKYLRDQIRQTIFRPHPFKSGEVVIRFVLFRDGTLKDVSIIDKLSAKNAYLRYAAVKAVKDAAPFKSFPGELAGIKELPFQVPISFEITN